jgi:hypothetical protein
MDIPVEVSDQDQGIIPLTKDPLRLRCDHLKLFRRQMLLEDVGAAYSWERSLPLLPKALNLPTSGRQARI